MKRSLRLPLTLSLSPMGRGNPRPHVLQLKPLGGFRPPDPHIKESNSSNDQMINYWPARTARPRKESLLPKALTPPLKKLT